MFNGNVRQRYNLRSLRLFQVSLELGGKSPHIIFESADLDQGMFPFDMLKWQQLTICYRQTTTAANWTGLGILYNTGQDCTAGSRLFVQDTIYDKFMSMLIEKVKQLTISHGFDENAQGGPVVSR